MTASWHADCTALFLKIRRGKYGKHEMVVDLGIWGFRNAGLRVGDTQRSDSIMEDSNSRFRVNWLYLVSAIFLGLLIHDYFTYRSQVSTVPYSQFLAYLNEQKVESVKIVGDRVEGTLKNVPKGAAAQFVAIKVEDPNLSQKLMQSNIRFEAVHESTWLRDLVSLSLPILLMLGLWWFLAGRMGKAQGQLFSLGQSKAKVYVEHDLKTKFSDVAGVDEGKAELQEVVQFLKNPSQYNRLGGRMPKGLLLVGPPGTGKTLLARAVAGEAQVPFFSINGSEFVEMFVGLGAARVRDLFLQARKQTPCIIFIDELDAIGKARGLPTLTGGSNDEKEQTLNQLLAELDGFDPSQGVVLLAATNRPEVLDPALLRSGRFDRQIMIDKPDRKGREEILKIHMQKVTWVKDLSIEKIAGLTTGFSGADLANLVNEAALIATRRGAEKVEERDFTAGIERIVGGLERKSRILAPNEKKRIAHHEMGHAVVSLAISPDESVHKVSIIPRGFGTLGYTMRRPTEDRYLMDRDELECKMAVILGGRAAEYLFFKEVSTGASDDLDKSTDIARSMVTRYGMSETLGLLTFDRESAPLLDGRSLMRSHDYSEDTARLIDREIKEITERAFRRALSVLRQHRFVIEEGVRLLLEIETIDEQTLKNIWKSQPASEDQSSLTSSIGLGTQLLHPSSSWTCNRSASEA